MRHLNDPRESKMWRVSMINDTGVDAPEGYPKTLEELDPKDGPRCRAVLRSEQASHLVEALRRALAEVSP